MKRIVQRIVPLAGLGARGQNPHGIRASMHPGWIASLCVAFRANSAAIPPSKRLAGPAPHRSRCSRWFIHGLLGIVACGGGDRDQRALIQNRGSDTLLNVAQAWAETYKNVNTNVSVAVTGGGSGTGISAMINGTVDIANSSRKMRESELEAARSNGVEPIEFIVGYDALAVYLHADNPIESMTLALLKAIYGEGGDVTRWSDLGVAVPGCGTDEIVLVSRQNNSGTYVYFKEAVLGDDTEYKLGSRDMHGSKDVVELVENTPCAIGYSGLAYATEHVRMPCIAAEEGADCVEPTIASAVTGTYPIARPLMMYTAGRPQGAIKDYMDWIRSAEGQCVILERGYAPYTEVECA